ncbi:hypothetical protein AXG93_3988s1090 [Marchantia polymorpha subsp. ruderalis]|uniref:Uncharacterized protein n=1 Tax=Marchantia polymorpha subsp. ruderalis TaxID=1480154 RepID=A0A176VNB6_MARPO|nr:hypothetical protein AXG93_3988s1090 [Marchantia polymorpha subsp. ruderalis]
MEISGQISPFLKALKAFQHRIQQYCQKDRDWIETETETEGKSDGASQPAPISQQRRVRIGDYLNRMETAVPPYRNSTYEYRTIAVCIEGHLKFLSESDQKDSRSSCQIWTYWLSGILTRRSGGKPPGRAGRNRHVRHSHRVAKRPGGTLPGRDGRDRRMAAKERPSLHGVSSKALVVNGDPADPDADHLRPVGGSERTHFGCLHEKRRVGWTDGRKVNAEAGWRAGVRSGLWRSSFEATVRQAARGAS